ncbi:aspartate/glutamate racemase family protein [Mangrovivirga cuniculi]|uniref:Aspartate racemase n=1 Tax=Mangrovivirga cuniculi TaxID=2715131 RepID=A0A4D7JKE1_9BACT|nr:amino acid racemase [Mangrovivirga cuniculi]QCK15167.1 aspartate racemase [Mangrovivirga cuniculi]
MKTLGLIGGTSWYSTLVYYREINKRVGDLIGSQGNPELILYSINIELMREMDKEKIKSKYLTVSKKLQDAGAEAIMICANTPHLVYEYVQPKIDIPILHIGDAIGRNAIKRELKTLGLLGNKPTMTGDFISGYLKRNFDIDVILPQDGSINKSHYFVSKELTQGKFTKNAEEFYLEKIKEFEKANVDGVILGCTELPLLIKHSSTNLPLLATTDLHIEMAVEFILS